MPHRGERKNDDCIRRGDHQSHRASRPPRLRGVAPHSRCSDAAYNIPPDVLRERKAGIVGRLSGHVVFVCRSDQRGIERWDIERQVRLVAGSIVLTSLLGSITVPKLKWLVAAVGGGLTFAAVSNTCATGTALSKLPYRRTPPSDAPTIVAKLPTTRADT
jgi:hypothetical protein